MRISIKKYNRPYLERLASQMESNPAEAINYLLTELRRVGYSFNSNITLAVGFEPMRSIESHDLGYSIEAEVNPKDPTIQHLLSVGLEEF